MDTAQLVTHPPLQYLQQQQNVVIADIQTGSISTTPLSSILKVSGKINVPPQNMVSINIPLGVT